MLFERRTDNGDWQNCHEVYLQFTIMCNSNVSNSSLNILFWNCQGIKGKILEFYDLVKNKNIDIACLNETCLKPKDNISSLMSHNIIRLDRVN